MLRFPTHSSSFSQHNQILGMPQNSFRVPHTTTPICRNYKWSRTAMLHAWDCGNNSKHTTWNTFLYIYNTPPFYGIKGDRSLLCTMPWRGYQPTSQMEDLEACRTSCWSSVGKLLIASLSFGRVQKTAGGFRKALLVFTKSLSASRRPMANILRPSSRAQSNSGYLGNVLGIWPLEEC